MKRPRHRQPLIPIENQENIPTDLGHFTSEPHHTCDTPYPSQAWILQEYCNFKQTHLRWSPHPGIPQRSWDRSCVHCEGNGRGWSTYLYYIRQNCWLGQEGFRGVDGGKEISISQLWWTILIVTFILLLDNNICNCEHLFITCTTVLFNIPRPSKSSHR